MSGGADAAGRPGRDREPAGDAASKGTRPSGPAEPGAGGRPEADSLVPPPPRRPAGGPLPEQERVGGQPWMGGPPPAVGAPWPAPGPTPASAPASGGRSPLAVLAFAAAAAAVVVPTLSILGWHLFIELPFSRALSAITAVVDGLVAVAALVVGLLVVRRPRRVERLAGGLALGAGAVGVLEAGAGLVISLALSLLH